MFAAVVLLVVVEAELLTVVAAADQVPLAPGVSVMGRTVARTVAVALTLIAGLLRCTAPPALVVTTGTALARRRVFGNFPWKYGICC